MNLFCRQMTAMILILKTLYRTKVFIIVSEHLSKIRVIVIYSVALHSMSFSELLQHKSKKIFSFEKKITIMLQKFPLLVNRIPSNFKSFKNMKIINSNSSNLS